MRDIMMMILGAMMLIVAVKFIGPVHASDNTLEHRVQRLEMQMEHIRHVASEHGINI